MIADNLTGIRERIGEAAIRVGRNPEEIRIVGAAKKQSMEKIQQAVEAGLRIIGHNYVQEAAEQLAMADISTVELHMIGHLQRNKAGKAVELFDVIETVDDERLVSALDRRARDTDKIIGVMIQVNVSGEAQKSGTTEGRVKELAEAVRNCANVRLLGLMTMPPFFDDPQRARPYFAQLRQIRDRLLAAGVLTPDMNELSMGMTGDFEVAVEEGSTLVRIGTALFGARY